jgi:hypothetical protein
VGFSVVNNHLKKMILGSNQTLRCVICHPTKQCHNFDSTIKFQKGFITYNPQHGITSMNNHIDIEHGAMVSKYKNHCTKEIEFASLGHGKSKQCKGVAPSTITEYFGSQQPYKSFDPMQICFIEDLMLFVAKGYEVLSMVECPWLHHLVMRQNGKVCFHTRKQLVKNHIPPMLAKTMDCYVFPILVQCDTIVVPFDMWMLRMDFDTFALIMNFLNWEWVPCHVTIGLFEAPNTSGVALA